MNKAQLTFGYGAALLIFFYGVLKLSRNGSSSSSGVLFIVCGVVVGTAMIYLHWAVRRRMDDQRRK